MDSYQRKSSDHELLLHLAFGFGSYRTHLIYGSFLFPCLLLVEPFVPELLRSVPELALFDAAYASLQMKNQSKTKNKNLTNMTMPSFGKAK